MGTINQTTAYMNQQYSDFMVTPDGGMAVKAINNTGSASVKGTVLQAGEVIFNSTDEQTVQFDAVAIMYSDGVADGESVWVVTSGKAKVLLEDSTASTLGYWVFASTQDGRGNATLALPSGGTIGAIDEHFKEIGHCLESVTAGTDQLALCFIHFN